MTKQNTESEEQIPEGAKEIHLENTGEIDLPQIDISKHIGKKMRIARVTEHAGDFGFFIKVATDIVETITGGKNPIELRATRLFGLQQDDEGNVGWGKTVKLGLFLKKMGVSHYKDLVGKTVIVQSQTNKEGREFLTFN